MPTNVKICLVCGNAIEGKTSNNRKYCCTHCRRVAASKQRVEYIKTRANKINPISQIVYLEYDCRCALCGWRASSELLETPCGILYSFGNEKHHIVPAREGGRETEDNIILLCPNHHKMADLGLISRSELRKHTRHLAKTVEEAERKLINRHCLEISEQIFDSDKQKGQ